jgi:hypothetical protein
VLFDRQRLASKRVGRDPRSGSDGNHHGRPFATAHLRCSAPRSSLARRTLPDHHPLCHFPSLSQTSGYAVCERLIQYYQGSVTSPLDPEAARR